MAQIEKERQENMKSDFGKKYPSVRPTAATASASGRASLSRALRDMSKNRHWTLTTQTIGGEEVTYFEDKTGKPIITTPMVKPLVAALHASGGCASMTRLIEVLQEHFNVGKYMTNAVNEAVRQVQFACAVCKGDMKLPQKQHKESIYSYEFGERFQIDASEVAPNRLQVLRKHGYRYLLTCIDCTSKMGWVWALMSLKMDEAFQILRDHFDRVMVPDILHSDNGPQFRNKLITALSQLERFAHVCGASDTPQHQGQVEIFNKTIKRKLFIWIKQNPKTAVDEWHTKGVFSITDEYNNQVHSTTRQAPYAMVWGRLRTHGWRQMARQDSLVNHRLLADRSERYPNAGTAIQRSDVDFVSACVTAHLERREHRDRSALTGTAKRQTANQLRRAGLRLTDIAIPRVGQKILFRRPVKKPTAFEANNPALARNVEGVIDWVSTVAHSVHVQWEDEEAKARANWIFPTEMLITDFAACETYVQPTPFWPDIKRIIRDTSYDARISWKDAKSLRQILDSTSLTLEEIAHADGIIETMDLPNPKALSRQTLGEAIVLQVLDRKLFTRLRCMYSFSPDKPQLIDEDDVELMMRHLSQTFAFEDFIGAASRWQYERSTNPSLVYPSVLEAVHGKPHVCSECCMSEACEPEHVCCYYAMTMQMERQGWRAFTSHGKPTEVLPEGTPAHSAPRSSNIGNP
jgi:transposase InsO family protein